MDASGDVSAETDDLPDWLTFELSSREQRFADALVDMAEHCLASPAGHWKRRRTGRRYEVVLTIDRNELAKQQSAGGARYHVEPDWGIDEEDARHIACDADLTEFVEDARGNLLNYERRRRIVPARLLRALKLRDQNRCRFPGCAHSAMSRRTMYSTGSTAARPALTTSCCFAARITGCCTTALTTSRPRTVTSSLLAGMAKWSHRR